jgi:hypothetical protein
MPRKPENVHSSIKKRLGYDRRTSARRILADWTERTRCVCKPCWELKYCPYGPLVEDSPLLPPTLEEVEHHNAYLRECLASGRLGGGGSLDAVRRKDFESEVREFDPKKYPRSLPKVLIDASCLVFGHLCPVFFVSEAMTETRDIRTHTRTIPRDVMLKVVRRDGQICQRCFQPVPDNQIEFDHVIPFGKGGATTVDNLRLLCRDCNRKKKDALADLLSSEFVELLEAQRKERGKKADGTHRAPTRTRPAA